MLPCSSHDGPGHQTVNLTVDLEHSVSAKPSTAQAVPGQCGARVGGARWGTVLAKRQWNRRVSRVD